MLMLDRMSESLAVIHSEFILSTLVGVNNDRLQLSRMLRLIIKGI